MKRLLTMLGCVLAAASILVAQDAQPTWQSFVGFWRMDPAMLERSPTTPLIMKIVIVGSELTIERRTITQTTETSRYRLDGTSASTVLDGQPVAATAVLENGLLIITTRTLLPGLPGLPGGRAATIKETYSVLRKRLTIDRTTTVGNRTTVTNDLLRRLPEPTPPRPRRPRNVG